MSFRAAFPQLKRVMRGDRPLVYLDSAATSLKPLPVIEAVREAMSWSVANVHRGAHQLGDELTERFEGAREKVRKFVGASRAEEIVFTRGTTEGLNLLASSLGRTVVKSGDVILLSQMEHHSNIVPWMMMAEERGARVEFVRVTDTGELDRADFSRRLLGGRVKIVSLVHVSNVLGTVNPLAEMFVEARAQGAVCVADAAQSVAALGVDVQTLGCDFLVFSGHKMFAPTGVGVLYGRYEWLDRLSPYQGGGSMISKVSEQGVEFLAPPHRFEAGTPPIVEVLGLGAAVDFISEVGRDRIVKHEKELQSALREGVASIPDWREVGTSPTRTHAVSFLLGDAHPGDVSAILDEMGIAVRSGHHCCQPLMQRFGIGGTVRASFSIYNSTEDIEMFLRGLKKTQEILS